MHTISFSLCGMASPKRIVKDSPIPGGSTPELGGQIREAEAKVEVTLLEEDWQVLRQKLMVSDGDLSNCAL
jgi:hypothetical protein